MIRWLWKWLKRLLVVAVLLILALLAPVGYVEVACRGGDAVASDYQPLLPEAWHRAEGRTLMTYPEWHIVHAYDDYAQVITEGDPHDFGYLKAVGGFWGSLCALSEASPPHGGFDWTTKQTIYVIGVSFTAELMLKAAYEETVGRFYTWRRGPEHSTLDDLSARHYIVTAMIEELITEYDGVIPPELEDVFAYLNEQNVLLARRAARGVMPAFSKQTDENDRMPLPGKPMVALPAA